FSGVKRRLELKGRINPVRSFAGFKRKNFWFNEKSSKTSNGVKTKKNSEIIFIDDYGHHPTEICATLETVKENFPDRRLLVVFQPHRYSRTKILYRKFGKVFKEANIVRLCEIYPAGENPIKGVSSELILKEIRKNKKDIEMFEFNKFLKEIKPGDVVLTLGAGDVWQTGEKLIHRLKK
ncbi:MAG: cyanophycin synthetase, partial [Patescibacteria group bacterium]